MPNSYRVPLKLKLHKGAYTHHSGEKVKWQGCPLCGGNPALLNDGVAGGGVSARPAGIKGINGHLSQEADELPIYSSQFHIIREGFTHLKGTLFGGQNGKAIHYSKDEKKKINGKEQRK